MVHGRAQHYAWGDLSSIPEMVGRAPDGQPWAEWWMGTHPLAPSTRRRGCAAAIGRRRPAVPAEVHGCRATAVAADPPGSSTRPRPGSSARSNSAYPVTRRRARTATRSPSRRCSALSRRSTRCAASGRSTTRCRCCTSSTHTTSPSHPAARGAGDHGRGALSTQVRHRVDDRGVPPARSSRGRLWSPSSPRRIPVIPRSSSRCCSTGCSWVLARPCSWARATCTPTSAGSASR